MTPLRTLLAEKLAVRLPAASLLPASPLAGEPAEDTAMQIELSSHDPINTETFHVSIPLAACQGWTKETLKLLLEEILHNCELKLFLSHQEARYESYLREVKTTKEKLLPHTAHSIEGIEYAVHYAPSIGGGGDYFDIVDLRDARRRAGIENDDVFWGASLFDVSGHGPGAAVEVAMIDAILRTYQGGPGKGPGDVLTYLNRHFFTRQGRGGFVTGVVCNFNATTSEFTYASAGHLPLLIKRKAGELQVIDDHPGIPIGIDRDTQWETVSLALHSGDTIVMLTDGITEARSENNSEFGFDTVQTLLASTNFSDPDHFLAVFQKAFNEHLASDRMQDDQTLIVMELKH